MGHCIQSGRQQVLEAKPRAVVDQGIDMLNNMKTAMLYPLYHTIELV